MGFTNALTGENGSLIYPQIKSPDYAAGVAGWEIRKDGSAEFNNLDVRGTFVGSDYVINDLGLFVYNGTPTAGNLILSIASVAGVDTFGNAYGSGLYMIGGPSSLQFNIGSPIIQQTYKTGNPNATGATIEANTSGAGNAQNDFLLIGSAIDLTHVDRVGALFNGSSKDGTTSAFLALFYDVSPIGEQDYFILGQNGVAISAGTIVAPQPGVTPAIPETWHTPALAAGWATGATAAGNQPLRYRRNANGMTELVGVIHTTTTTPAANPFTLPANYKPVTNAQQFGVVTNASGTVAAVRCMIGTSGNCSFVPAMPASANVDVVFNAIFEPS
jgi:hypothetical protein